MKVWHERRMVNRIHLQLLTSSQQSQSPEDQATGECEFKSDMAIGRAGFACFVTLTGSAEDVRGRLKSEESGGPGDDFSMVFIIGEE